MTILPTYDTTKVSSLSLTPSQLGSSTIASSTWTTRTFPFTSGQLIAPGFAFDFSVNNESEQGLALAPRIPFTAATDDLAGTGETAETWTLTLNTTNTSREAVSAILYGVTTHTPSAFSTGNDPFTLSTTSGSSFLIAQISILTASNWVQNESGLFDLVFDLDFLDDYTFSVSGTAASSPSHAIVNNSSWNGVVQFFLIPSVFWSVTLTAATFVGKTNDWHTGQMGVKLDQRGRAVHDYITGQPYMSNRAVPDGFRDGIMVHPDNWDPDDPLDTDPFTPPPGEGVVDDEITDIE